MYERMIGDALHADRLRGSMGKMPLVEAALARSTRWRAAASQWCRYAVAKALIALSARLATPVTAWPPPTRALAQ
jgi:hypothetical protein